MREWMQYFKQCECTQDGTVRVSPGGVKSIYIAPDRKSEFLVMDNDDVYVRLKSLISKPILYPLSERIFKPKAKAVLMDLDGTSVISEEFWIWIIECTMKKLIGDDGFQLRKEDIPFVSGFSVSEHLSYCIQKYFPKGDLTKARSLYFETTRYEMSQILKGTGNREAFQCRKHLKEFLLGLKENGIKIGLVTSGLYEKAMPEIISAFDQMKLGNPLEFYDAVITAGTAYGKGQSGTLGELCAKPHPWLYREIGQVALGITEEESDRVVVLEDSSAGVMSGRLAGYPVIAMHGGNVKEAGLMPLTTLYSENLMEVLKYLIG